MKKYSYKIWLLSLLVFLCGGCGASKLPSLAIAPNSTVDLVASDGSVPAKIVFEEAPISTQELGSGEVTGVAFTADIDLNQSTSPEAFAAIQGSDQILLEMIFINLDRKEQPFQIEAIQKGQPLTKHIFRQNLPFALSDIAKIVLKVDRKEVAFAPR